MANEVVVDRMVVKLTADVKELQKTIEDMKKKYSQMEIGSGSKSIKAEKEKTQIAQKRIKDEVKAEGKKGKTGDSFSSSIKALGGLLAKFAVIGTIIKSVISGMSKLLDEGRTNLYNYSRLTGSSISGLMDKRSSALEALGNSFAALEATFVQVIVPILNQILEKATQFINNLTHVVADLFNLPSYYQANSDIFKAWSKNIKDTRMLISGLDSLNIFSGPMETPTEKMFTEVQRTSGDKSGIQKMIDDIKTGFLGLITNIETGFTNALNFIDPDGRLASLFGSLKSTAFGLIKALFGEDVAQGIKELDFSKISKGIDKFLEDTGLKGLIDSILELSTAVAGIVDEVVNSTEFQNFVTTLKTIIGVIAGITTTSIQLLADFFDVLRGEKSFSDMWENFKKNIVEAVGAPLEKLWNQIKAYFLGMINDFLVSVHNAFHPLNKINRSSVYDAYEKAYYDAFGSLPSTSIHTSSSGTEHGGGGRSMASGGVVKTPTLTWVGEYSGAQHNPEIVTPQNILDQRLLNNNKILLQSLNSMTNNIVNAVRDMSMDVRIGNQTIAQSASRGNNSFYKMNGKSIMA